MHEFERFLTTGLQRGAVAVTPDGRLVAYLELSDYDSVDRHAQLSVAGAASFVGSGFPSEGAILFLDECFGYFELRKVYITLSESSRALLESGLGDLFHVEGLLRAHRFLDGRFQDVTIASVTRDQFEETKRGHPIWFSEAVTVNQAGDQGFDLLAAVADLSGNEHVTLGSRIESLGLDSLGFVELIASCEAAAGRTFPDELWSSVETVQDLAGWVDRRSATQPLPTPQVDGRDRAR